MEEDIDEVLLRLTNKSVMHDKSNAKYNLTSTNNVLDLESESDDCCTSVSQRPVNPLSVLGTPASNSLPLPAVKMVTYDRFWQGQTENLANDNKEDFSELSSSVGTFSVESKKRHPVIFSEWCPILRNRKLQITGVTIDGNVDSRSIDRRISGYIFFDKLEVPCSLGGPMTLLNSQPKFIQHKFALGIPEDWVQVQSIWNSFEKLGSPENFAWLSSTDIDTSDGDLTITGYDPSVIPSTKRPISTPRNNTTDFYSMTTDISKINASDGLRTYPQKLFHNAVNSTASRSMKKTYTSAALKKKMNKIRSMLKVTLMRECSKLTSFKELVELQENDLNMRTCNVEVPVDNGVPQSKIIASDSNNEYLLQNKLPEHLVIKNLSKNNVHVPTTSQSKIIELAEPENSLHNKVAIYNNADSLKTTTNVFLNKSQFLSKNKSCSVAKDISSSSKNSGKTKLHAAETNKTTIANVSQKFHKHVSQKDNLSSEMSELCVSANQSSKTNSSEKKLLKNSAVFKVSVNNSKNSTPPTSSTEEFRNYVPSNIIRKHRNSLTLLLNKNGIEHKSASGNSSEMDNLDVYPTNSDSVVISFHNINQINVTSDVNTAHTAKNNSFDVENVPGSLKKSITDNIHNDKVVHSEEHHLESSFEDSIFSSKSKKAGNTNKGKFNTPIYETSVNKDKQYSNQTTKVISNQNSFQINKEVPANVDIPHYDKTQNNSVGNKKVIRNKILFSSESSDDDDNQNTNQRNKAANTNVEISNSDKRLNLVTKTIEEKRNKSNSESSDDGSVNSILANEIITQSSNVKSKHGSQSSDNSETQESHVLIVTNAVVHSAVKASVKSSQVSATLQEQQNSKSGTRMNIEAIVEKSNEMYTNDNLEVISSVRQLTDDKSANRSNNKIKSPEKRNTNNSSLERKGKKNTKGKKSHGEDKATNQNIMQEDSLMQFTEETIQEQSLPGTKQTPKSSKGRNNAKREKGTIQNEKSISTNLTLEIDLSVNNTTFSRKGRARCPTLPFWTGARFVTIGDETMVTKVSALNASNRAVENKKRLLTPQRQTTVAKKARTKTPQKSPVKILNTEPTVLSPASNAGTEQRNKNVVNAETKTPKSTKNLHGASKSKTEKSRVRTKNTKLNILSCSSNDTKNNNFVDSLQNSNSTRNSRSRSRSQNENNKINDKSVTEAPSSEIFTSPIMNDRLLTPQNQISVAQRTRTETPQKSPVKVYNTKPVVLSPASSAKTVQQNKNIANVPARTPKNIKNLSSTSKTETEESSIRTTKNAKLNTLPSNDTTTNNFTESVQRRYPIRSSRSPGHSLSKYYKINSVTDVLSCEICTSPISTNEKQSHSKNPVKLSRSVSTKNIKKLLNEENASAKCSPKSKDAKKPVILNKVSTNTTLNVDRDTNISIIKENGKRVFSPIKSKTTDISQNSPLQREGNTNIKVVDDICFTPIKSYKKSELSSKDSGVEINNIDYTDELMEYSSIPINKRNAKLNNNTTLQMASMNTEIDINNVEPTVEISNGTMPKENINLQAEIVRNKNEIGGQSKYSKKRNVKREEEKRRTQKGNIKSSTLNTNNQSLDTSNVDLIEHEVENRRNKKKGQKHEVNVQDVTIKQLRSRSISFEIINNMPKSHGITNLKPQASTLKPSKSLKLNSPKKLTNTGKRETHEMVIPTLPPKKSRKTRDSNKRELRSNSVSLLSPKQNSLEQSRVINSNSDKRKTLKNNEKNSSNELAVFKEPGKKSKKLKQNATQDKNLTWNNADCVSSLPNKSKPIRKYNMTDGGIDYNFSESNSQETGQHKTNSTQTVDQLYDEYVNNKCIALVTPLSTEEIEKFTKVKSSVSLVQSTMNSQESRSVNQTTDGKTAEKNVSSSSKAKPRSSSKKPRKQKTVGETYFGDPVRMSLMIKLKRKRQPKEKQSINTTEIAANASTKSINSTNNVTRKTGKRKLYNETDWLNSQECLQTFTKITEPCRSQNFCLQFEENNVEHDYFDDDVISEVSALAKVQ